MHKLIRWQPHYICFTISMMNIRRGYYGLQLLNLIEKQLKEYPCLICSNIGICSFLTHKLSVVLKMIFSNLAYLAIS